MSSEIKLNKAINCRGMVVCWWKSVFSIVWQITLVTYRKTSSPIITVHPTILSANMLIQGQFKEVSFKALFTWILKLVEASAMICHLQIAHTFKRPAEIVLSQLCVMKMALFSIRGIFQNQCESKWSQVITSSSFLCTINTQPLFTLNKNVISCKSLSNILHHLMVLNV